LERKVVLNEQRELEAAQEIIRQERYLANLPYAYFIDAEKQYRDCNRRCIDPYKKIIYRFSKRDPIWEETNEVLTFTDNINADAYVNAHHDMNIIADTNNDDAYIADINDDDDDAYIADTNSDAVANSDANAVANANAVAKSDAEELERLYIKNSLPMSFAMNYQTEHGINSDDHAFYGKPSLLEYVKSYVTDAGDATNAGDATDADADETDSDSEPYMADVGNKFFNNNGQADY
jgi:hypothetical protein